MQTGWFKINGADYYATSSGAITAQWVGSGNTWYYVDAVSYTHLDVYKRQVLLRPRWKNGDRISFCRKSTILF